MSDLQTIFKIHPSIGIARLGNTDDDFYLSPEQPGALPIVCDDQGREQFDEKGQPKRISSFKDASDLSKLRKQAARFRVYAYDSEGEEGKGLTSYQMIFKDNRWWIANILFTGAEGVEIPPKYLKN